MPAIETQGRFQKAVLWANAGVDAYNEPVVEAPVEIVVRWEAVTRESATADGTPISIVADLMVNQDIPIGSIMWEGALADLPDPPTNLKYVQSSDSTIDVKGRVSQRNVSLMEFNDNLPDIPGTGT